MGAEKRSHGKKAEDIQTKCEEVHSLHVRCWRVQFTASGNNVRVCKIKATSFEEFLDNYSNNM